VFFNDPAPNRRNSATITAFLDTIGKPKDPNSNYKTAKARRVWAGVGGTEIAGLLGNLLFPEEARDVNASRLSAYVREQLSAGELTDWTVAVLSGDGETIACTDGNSPP